MERSSLHGKNYYEILNVARDVTSEELRRAKLRLIRQYSNERYPEEFMLINEAFDVLNDPAKRAEYDAALDGKSSAYLDDEIDQCLHYIDLNQYQQAEQIVKRLYLDYPFHPEVLQIYSLVLYQLERHQEEKKLYETLIRNSNEVVAEGHLLLLIDYIVSQQYINERNWFINGAKQLLVKKARELRLSAYVHERISDLYEEGQLVAEIVRHDLADVLNDLSLDNSNRHFYELVNRLKQEMNESYQSSNANERAQSHHEAEAPQLNETYNESYSTTYRTADERYDSREAAPPRKEAHYSLVGNIIFSILLSLIFTPLVGIIAFAIIHFIRVPIWRPIFSFVIALIKIVFVIIVIGLIIGMFL